MHRDSTTLRQLVDRAHWRGLKLLLGVADGISALVIVVRTEPESTSRLSPLESGEPTGDVYACTKVSSKLRASPQRQKREPRARCCAAASTQLSKLMAERVGSRFCSVTI